MLTKESLTTEVTILREQLGKAQDQLAATRSQVKQLTATVNRLQGALIYSEKYLAQLDAQEGVPAPATPNGTAPERVRVQG